MSRIVAVLFVTAALLTATGTAGAAAGQLPAGAQATVAGDGFGWGSPLENHVSPQRL